MQGDKRTPILDGRKFVYSATIQRQPLTDRLTTHLFKTHLITLSTYVSGEVNIQPMLEHTLESAFLVLARKLQI
jgi:hypothetical protein